MAPMGAPRCGFGPRPRRLGPPARCARPRSVGAPALRAGLRVCVGRRVARGVGIGARRQLVQRVHPHAPGHGGRARPRRLPRSRGRDAFLPGGRNPAGHGRRARPRRHRFGGGAAARSLHGGGRARRFAARGRPDHRGARHRAAHCPRRAGAPRRATAHALAACRHIGPHRRECSAQFHRR